MIQRSKSLARCNTFGLDIKADAFISVRSEISAISLLQNRNSLPEPLFVIGEGSNLLFISDFHGTILHPVMKGIRIEHDLGGYVIVSAGAGVLWDNFVSWTVNKGLGGLENLSYIPGTVGATPVQNIGAYGVEVQQTIEKVRAVSLENGTVVEFKHDECKFGYRNSIFKNELKNRFLISRVSFRLSKKPVLNTSYGLLSEEVSGSGSPSVRTVREAVIKIRRSKLPDPEITGNAGSFFRNPLISTGDAEILQKNYPDIPVFRDTPGGRKLAAGWLIEKCGWKGYRSGDAGVHDKQSLVLVNYGKATGREIFELSEKIRLSVYDKFRVNLEREVEIIGDTDI